MKMHYAGEIIHERGNILPGWAACCSGERAINIRSRGNHTYDETEVTCAACQSMLAKHKAFAPRYRELMAKQT